METEVIVNDAAKKSSSDTFRLGCHPDELVNQITRVINSQRKINRKASDIQEQVEILVKYVRYFNSLDQYDKSCFKDVISLSEIIILNEFKDLIYPSSIKRVAGSYVCKELLLREDKLDDIQLNQLSLSEYTTCINTIRTFTKRDAFTDFVKLSDLKLEVSLESVINKISYNSRVRVQNDWFYPIPVNTDNDFNELYFNTELSECVINYFSLLKVN